MIIDEDVMWCGHWALVLLERRFSMEKKEDMF